MAARRALVFTPPCDLLLICELAKASKVTITGGSKPFVTTAAKNRTSGGMP
jgi:hypothetical protein